MFAINLFAVVRSCCIGSLVLAASSPDPEGELRDPADVDEGEGANDGTRDLVSPDASEPTAAWTQYQRMGDWHGGGGGSGFQMVCAPGYVAVGFQGRSGAVVDRISLVCAAVLDGGGLGSRYVAGSAGGGGGGAFSLECDAGFALESIYGRHGALIDRIGIRCGKLNGTHNYVGGGAGGGGGAEFWDPAAPGQFVTGLVGRSGLYVDALQAQYSTVHY